MGGYRIKLRVFYASEKFLILSLLKFNYFKSFEKNKVFRKKKKKPGVTNRFSSPCLLGVAMFFQLLNE